MMKNKDNVKICPKCHKEAMYPEQRNNGMWFFRCCMCNYQSEDKETFEEAILLFGE